MAIYTLYSTSWPSLLSFLFFWLRSVFSGEGGSDRGGLSNRHGTVTYVEFLEVRPSSRRRRKVPRVLQKKKQVELQLGKWKGEGARNDGTTAMAGPRTPAEAAIS